jgi:transposase
MGKIKTLHAWMKKADACGLYGMQRFVRRLKQDQKRQMYGRAGFALLRARVLPLPPPTILHYE